MERTKIESPRSTNQSPAILKKPRRTLTWNLSLIVKSSPSNSLASYLVLNADPGCERTLSSYPDWVSSSLDLPFHGDFAKRGSDPLHLGNLCTPVLYASLSEIGRRFKEFLQYSPVCVIRNSDSQIMENRGC